MVLLWPEMTKIAAAFLRTCNAICDNYCVILHVIEILCKNCMLARKGVIVEIVTKFQ